jgi:hypothetical protein
MPSHTPDDYARLEIHSRRALRQHELKERELIICHLIIDFSYARCRPAAWFPSQSHIAIITNISKGNISTFLAGLEGKRILLIDRAAGLYTFQADPSGWKVPSRFPTDAHARAAARVEDWIAEAADMRPEQLHLLEPLPDLDILLADEGRLEVLRKTASPGTPLRADSEGSSALHPRGDMSDRAEINARIAHSLATAGGGQVPNLGTSVPNLGTPHLMHLSASYSSHLDESSKCAVPDLGTASRKPGIERELLGEIGRRCGKQALDEWGGWWRLRIRQHPVDVREALGELVLRAKDPRLQPLRNPGAWLRKKYLQLTGEGEP